MRQKNRRRLAVLMAGVTMAMSAAAPVKAAAPEVQVDETMYVNLNYYGAPTQVNVVKGCTPNGVSVYTDYGVYDKLVNMTDKTEPSIGEGSVTWQLPEGNKRFYYQGTMPEGSVELPWSFDVSYKLNGAEIEAAALAGASGLVEMNVKAVPNPAARAYYRNNMILTVVVPVDMEKAYSVDAPGSQLQTLGNSTAVLFAALPGEEGDYTVRIGTDDFESVGIIMMMVPGTLDALNHIKDLKEAKDTWREDGDRMYESMDQLLESMESMRLDVTGVSGGLAELEQARASVSASRKQIEALSTEAVADLASVTEQTAVLIPYLETAKSAVVDINANFNAIYNTLEDTQDELDRLYDRLGGLRSSLESLARQADGGISIPDQKHMGEEIQKQTEEIKAILEALGSHLGNGTSLSDMTKEELDELEESLEQADAFRYNRKRGQKRDKTKEGGKGGESEADGPEIRATESEADIAAFGWDLFRFGPSGLPGSGGYNEEDFEEWSEELDSYADEVEESLSALLGTGYPDEAEELLSQISDILGGGSSIWQSAAAVIDKVNAVCTGIGNTSSKTASTVSALRNVTDELINLLDDSRVLIDTADSYVPSLLDSLSDTEELLRRLTRAMGTTHAFLNVVNTTLIAAGDSLDAGTRNSLQGLKGVLDKSLSVLDDISQIRQAGEGMKQTLDEQLDEFEEENLFLNMDPEADMVSFTSSKNPTPHSLQIILRTDEISEGDEATDISDMEDAETEDLGPFQRMWRVLVRIVQAVAAIFQDL